MLDEDPSSTQNRHRRNSSTAPGNPAPAPAGPAGKSLPSLLPSVSLPKGGGAIRGIGENFSMNPATGTGSLTVPIALSPGRNGTGPSLELAYDSGAGNGPFGLGWRLSVPAISRKTDKGLPRYSETGLDTGREADGADVFVLSGAEDLVPVRIPDGPGTRRDAFDQGDFRVERFRPRTEGLFARIERWTRRATGEAHWRVTTRDNVTSVYGLTAQARIADPADPRRVFTWLLEETRDDRGNLTRYVFKAEDGAGIELGRLSEASRFDRAGDGTSVFRATAQRYLKRVLYGNRQPGVAADWLFEVVFDFGEHDAATPTPEEAQPWPVRSDPFSSFRSGFEVRTWRLCRRVLLFHRFAELGATPALVRSTDFGYREGPALTQLESVTQAGYERDADTGLYRRAALPPLELDHTRFELHDELAVLDAASLEGAPAGVGGGAVQWVDLDGEGLPGVLTEVEGAWFYKANRGGGVLAAPRLVAPTPAPASLTGVQQLLDLGSDGRLDLASFTPPLTGYFTRTAEDDWTSFTPFSTLPARDWQDRNLRFVDLDGDGLSDVLVTEDDVFTWYPSRGKAGFAEAVQVRRPHDEDRGPAVVFADGTESIQLADMSGDGLVDLVRIRNGEVCYWPNLGYGRFGRKVTLEGSPRFDAPDRFDPRRIRFADVDGSGTSDVFYLASDRVAFWSNQAGNGFGERQEILALPPADTFSSVGVVDLLGQGTACLVWSSPLPADAGRPLAYVDLTGGVKPHLLRAVVNNLGAETRLGWAPSTRFYLEDKREGRPWLTRLHFPVHVVERIERYDGVTQARTVTTYRYRHGFFDGAEREFGGFAYSEQRDAESFGAPAGGGLFPEAPEVEPDLRLPPVVTRTWFHTGAWWDYQRLERELAREHYSLDAQAPRLPDTIVPAGLTVEEEREAARALRGNLLRQEIYAEDGTPASLHPYTVSERSYEVRSVQRREGERHAVFLVHPRETLSLHYERRPDDPRLGHEMVLAVDAFGSVTRAAHLGYPRRVPAEPEQGRFWITVRENDFANRPAEASWYRVGVPTGTRTWELTGLAVPAAGLIDRAVLDAAFGGAAEIPYEQPGDGAAVERRLVNADRRLYHRDDLAGVLPLGTIESRALPFESYRLAFTPGLLTAVYGGHVPAADLPALLTDHGRYVEQDGLWWMPSGRVVFDAAAFYLPVEAIDPFNETHRVTWDGYSLLVRESRDPLGNVVTADNDYRVLAPAQTTDSNGNRNAVRFDPLGMLVATAAMGKAGVGEGDTLADPTTRLEYDLDRWRTDRRPAFVHTFARERHGAANPRWQESFSYSDGGGHEAMKKIQAEPGPAPARDAEGRLIRDGGGALVLADTANRWVGTGRTVFDNKGNPVKQYEPFFSSTSDYEDEDDLVAWGVTPVFHYDPLGRKERTDHPNGTYSRVVYDAWRQESWDENDTVADSAWRAERQALPAGDPERRAADLAQAHAGTPSLVHLDSLSRIFLSVADNGAAGAFATRIELDVEGKQLSVTDGRGIVTVSQTFDVLGRKIHVATADAGESRTLLDVGDKAIRAWDARGQTIRRVFDELQRPTHLFVRRGAGAEVLRERTVYGEAHPAAADRNLRGEIYQTYDGAGVISHLRFDFKGNLTSSARRFSTAWQGAMDWSPLAAAATLADVEAAAEPLLEPPAAALTADSTWDALSRLTSQTTHEGSEKRLSYNEANLLEKVEVRVRGAAAWTTFVSDVDYNARGQRLRIDYGNGTSSAYEHDARTFRLRRLATTRAADNATLQDLLYTYDPVGNVVEVRDQAQQDVFFANAVVSAGGRYVYDALYQLIAAEGRELPAGQPTHDQFPGATLPHPNDVQALRRYTESYRYDEVGNLERVTHQAGPVQWVRHYEYAAASNRLLATSAPGDPAGGPWTHLYTHDPHGNMASMPHLPTMGWDHEDRLDSADRGGGGTVWFSYDSHGERARKAWAHGGLLDERLYFGGFELYRRRSLAGGAPDTARETLQVMDGERRIALIETKTRDGGADVPAPAARLRYQLNNHLGSATAELDETGLVFSYEEYFPFGETSFRSARAGVDVSPKRFRYTGKERDEETSLYYHGARYYAPWLGRWTSADPAGLVDGVNVYAYVSNNPLALSDPTGLWGWREVAVIAAVVVVGTVVTVATAGAAAPLIAGAVASVGLSGAAATVATGVAVGAVAGAVGGAAAGAAGETTRQVVHGEQLSGRRIAAAAGRGAVEGAVIGGAIGGAAALATTTAGAALAAGAGRVAQRVVPAAARSFAASAGRTVASSARALAQAPGIRQAVRAAGTVARGVGRGTQAIARAAGDRGTQLARAVFRPGTVGREAVERLATTGSLATTFHSARVTANLDTNTAIALVAQDSPVRQAIRSSLAGQELGMTQTAANELRSIVGAVGGPLEQARAVELLRRVNIIADNPSARVAGLRLTKSIQANDRIIFGTGDQLGIPTWSSDAKFGRGAAGQGVVVDVRLHPPQPLTGH